MVSKIIITNKRTPKNPNQGRRRRRKSPAKRVAAIINTCQRRLIKIFTSLVRIRTPSPNINNKYKKTRKQGYHRIPISSSSPSPRRRLFSGLLPPPLSPDKHTLILDLDETLIHSVPDPKPDFYDFVVTPLIDGVNIPFYVKKRPFVDDFLDSLSKRFELVVFTAGLEEYASLVLNKLDKNNVVSHRLYRGSCKEVDGRFLKDLGEVGRDLGRVAIVDDNPNAYVLNVENAIPVKAFVGDVADNELEGLVGFFEGCGEIEDMRDVVKMYLGRLN